MTPAVAERICQQSLPLSAVVRSRGASYARCCKRGGCWGTRVISLIKRTSLFQEMFLFLFRLQSQLSQGTNYYYYYRKWFSGMINFNCTRPSGFGAIIGASSGHIFCPGILKAGIVGASSGHISCPREWLSLSKPGRCGQGRQGTHRWLVGSTATLVI